MMYQQRSELTTDAPGSRQEFWLSRRAGPPSPQAGDYYVTIDERVEGTIRLSVAAWPLLDSVGRLAFPRRFRPVFVPEPTLEGAVNAFRREAGLLDRPLRVGDTFLVRSTGRQGPGSNVRSWELVFDVSSLARDESKIALYGAVAPVAEDDDLGETPGPAPDEAPRPGPTARAAV